MEIENKNKDIHGDEFSVKKSAIFNIPNRLSCICPAWELNKKRRNRAHPRGGRRFSRGKVTIYARFRWAVRLAARFRGGLKTGPRPGP